MVPPPFLSLHRGPASVPPVVGLDSRLVGAHSDTREAPPRDAGDAGAAILGTNVRAALNIRFRSGSQPTTLFVDRGAGSWSPRKGKITAEFKSALVDNSLRTRVAMTKPYREPEPVYAFYNYIPLKIYQTYVKSM